MKKLHDYILDEIGIETTDQDTTEYSNQRQSVLPRCQIGRLLMPRNEFTNFTAQIADTISR